MVRQLESDRPPQGFFPWYTIVSAAYHSPEGKAGTDDLDKHTFSVVDGAVLSEWGIWSVEIIERMEPSWPITENRASIGMDLLIWIRRCGLNSLLRGEAIPISFDVVLCELNSDGRS